jgi:hypothetical protein
MKVEGLLRRDRSFKKALKRMRGNLVKGGKENTVFPSPASELSITGG